MILMFKDIIISQQQIFNLYSSTQIHDVTIIWFQETMSHLKRQIDICMHILRLKI